MVKTLLSVLSVLLCVPICRTSLFRSIQKCLASSPHETKKKKIIFSPLLFCLPDKLSSGLVEDIVLEERVPINNNRKKKVFLNKKKKQ